MSAPAKEFKVVWTIHVSGKNHVAAAQEALAFMQDPSSEATCFEVTEVSPSDLRTPVSETRIIDVPDYQQCDICGIDICLHPKCDKDPPTAYECPCCGAAVGFWCEQHRPKFCPSCGTETV